jgi:hypothetical protein
MPKAAFTIIESVLSVIVAAVLGLAVAIAIVALANGGQI